MAAKRKKKKSPTKKRVAYDSEPMATHPKLAALPQRLALVRGGRSQRQFARELGVFQQNVNRYEHNTIPHAKFLAIVADHEKVSLDWLILGRGKREAA